MNLTECYAYHYVLKPDAQHSAELTGLNTKTDQTLKPNHKLVLAFASLSSYSEHTTTPPASAYAYFSEYSQHGEIKTVGDGLPLVVGDDITDLKWNMKADKCWVRGSFVILAFD